MYQKIVLIGYLGSAPDSRFTPAGKRVTNFSMATSRKWDGGEETTWWRVSCWERLAEITNQYLSKGSQVLVEGRMKPDPDTGNPRIYERNDGTPGASFEVTAGRVVFLDSKGDRQNTNAQSASQSREEDDIPF